MAFTDNKITEADIASHGVQSQPNKLTGTAAQNKLAFDKLVTEIVKEKLNALIDELLASGAAGQIGVAPVGTYAASTVQGVLAALKDDLQNASAGQLAQGSVKEEHLDSNAVTRSKIKDGEVTADKLAGSIPAAKLADDAVTRDKILDGEVTAAKLAGDITGDKIAPGTIESSNLGPGCVTAGKQGFIKWGTAVPTPGTGPDQIAEGEIYLKYS